MVGQAFWTLEPLDSHREHLQFLDLCGELRDVRTESWQIDQRCKTSIYRL